MSVLCLSCVTLALQGKGLLLCDAQRSEQWPCDCAGKDIIGLAQTGSGKTGAFALPILQVRKSFAWLRTVREAQPATIIFGVGFVVISCCSSYLVWERPGGCYKDD